MTIKDLYKQLLDIGVSEDRYYLHGLYGSSSTDNKLCLSINRGQNTIEYTVYYTERGEKHSEKLFTNEKEACGYFLYKIQEELTIEKVQNVIGLGGMTVNERLFATGLMDEFDKTKRRNKTRAAQILRILRVDEPSIKKILKLK